MRLLTNMKRNSNQILKELKQEINATLFFFVEMDIKMYGFVTESTKETFRTQAVKFPDEL